jgi:NADH:ubiquinone oxidoreductase subunit F (NADH-binding)
MGHRSLIIAAKATGARCVFDEGYIYSRTEYALAVERMKKNGAGCGQY